MTDSQRALFKGNLLYAICTWGLVAVGGVMGVVMVFTGGAMTAYSPLYSIVMAVSEFVPIVLPGLILLMLPAGRSFRSSMRLKFHPSALLALPMAAVGYLFVLGFTAVWTALLMGMGLEQTTGVPAPSGGTQLTVSLLIIAVWPALCEEFFFRGIMLPAYEKYFKNPVVAVCLTGALFGLMHGQPAGAPGHIFLGIVMGAVVVMTGSLWTGIIYHFTNNGMAMVLTYASGAIGEFMGTDASAAAGLESVEPGLLIMSGLMYIAVGGLLFAGFAGLMYLASRKRMRGDPSCRVGIPEPKVAPMRDPLSLQGDFILRLQTKRERLIPWIPLMAAAPIVLLNYAGALLLMALPGLL